MHRETCRGLAAAAAVALLPGGAAEAHGFAGDRFFPATILTDDPFVADEASLPTITLNPTQSDGSRELDFGTDLSKRLTPDWDVTFATQWTRLKPAGTPALGGWGGIATGTQYQLFVNAPHEALGLVALNVTWAHTGRASVGAPQFTTLSPTLDFGKGFGDLPQAVSWLRPFALTGELSFDFPTQTETDGAPNPNNFNYGFAVEYSIPYLQGQVKDVGLRPPFNRMIPLVEFSMTTPVNRGFGGMTTGTVQPGIIWAGQYFQLGAEMIIPTNSLSGHGIGGVFQLHFYFDDLFPSSLGKPVLQW